MDSKLSFDQHMNDISKSANYNVRRIAHISKYYYTRITRKLINARIDYGGSLFSDINSTDIKK